MTSNSKTLMSYKRNWQAQLLDYDFLLEQDETDIYYVCLTELERQMLLAAIPPLEFTSRYFSDTQEIDSDLVAAWYAALINKLLEQCMTCTNLYYLINQTNTLYVETIYNRYDGSTPSSVNENCPDDYFDGDGSSERVQALCMAIDAWLKSYCAAWLKNAAIVLGLGIVGLFLFALPILGPVAVILLGGLAFITQTYYDALQNESAIENVACDWFEALQGVAITRANWQTAIENLSYEGASDEYLIWQIICSEVTSDKQWVSFLDAIGNAYLIAAAGVQDCPCDDCTPWEYTLDFTTGDLSFASSPTSNRAVWNSGLGWSHGTFNNWVVQIISPTYSEFKLQAVKLKISIPSTGLRRCQFRVPTAYGTAYDETWGATELEHTITLPGDGILLTQFWASVDNYNVHWDGYFQSITLYGCGYNPFA